ncbi:hypothetical protein [Paracoccus sp. SCSIO 75233]|uniref:hypothetical protein n=1 Tax=Paracoccus sp. SCSIO 75233 TaxID=3017782 RepID=UPI0022F10335|nr:hypothetical protein [Paracoccus sp. SCSIO 75233]WBU52066.1 hypothetical protein PAF12_09455 [Paracoccus sp. SCSIO 75233]
MFAPEGYVSALSLADHIRQRLFDGRDDEFKKYSANLTDTQKGEFFERCLISYTLKPHQLIWNSIQCHQLTAYICSPDGILLKAANSFFLGGNGEIWLTELDPMDPDEDFLRLIDVGFETGLARKFLPVVDSGYFVSFRTWCIRQPERMRELIGGQFDEYEERFHIIREFSGWAVCFKDGSGTSESGFPYSAFPEYFAEDRQGQRGKGTNEIVSEIIARFDRGERVVRDKIKSELAGHLGTDSWRETWRMATSQRPSLSTPGPKKKTGC